MEIRLAVLLIVACCACQTTPLPPLLRQLESEERSVRTQAAQAIKQLHDRERIPLLKLGMRKARRSAAEWCALRLEGEHFALAELPEFIAFMRTMYDGGHAAAALEAVLPYIGSTEIEFELQYHWPRSNPKLSAANVYGSIHRPLRADHIPLLCRQTDGFADGFDAAQYSEAMRLIGLLLRETDRHRDTVAEALIWQPYNLERGQKGQEILSLRVYSNVIGGLMFPHRRDGYPPRLARCIEQIFHANRSDTHEFEHERRVRHWLWRWARDCRAGKEDRRLLLDLAKQKYPCSQLMALQGLRDLNDPGLRGFVRGLLERKSFYFPDHARRLLVKLGDETAKEELVQRAKTNSVALAHLLLVDLEQGKRVALEQYLRNAEVYEALPLSDDVDAHAEGWALDPRRHLGWLEKHLTDETIALHKRMRLLVGIRHFRRRANAIHFANADLYGKEDGLPQAFAQYCALLEVLDRPRLERLLAALAQKFGEDERDELLETLLRLGSASNDRLLIDFAARDSDRIRALGRTRSLAVRRRLLTLSKDPELEAPALHGLLIHAGIPTDMRLDGIADLSVADKKAIRAGKATEVVLRMLEREQLENPGSAAIYEMGLFRHPRVTARLRQLAQQTWRSERHELRLALARHGERSAIRECLEILRAGRHEWMPELGRVLIEHDLRLVPRMIQELESSCCRSSQARVWLSRLCDVELAADRVRTSAAIARGWWAEAERHLYYSVLADRYVIAHR